MSSFPLPGMEGTITRLNRSASIEAVLSQKHFPPYTTLPVLRLHIQPHYAVLDLYQKVLKHEIFIHNMREDKSYKSYLLKYFEADVYCRTAYLMWKTWDVAADFIGNSVSCGDGRSASLKLRPGAFSWDVDEVGLRPTDSVTYIPDREDGEQNSDDDADEYVVDEENYSFQARMRRWVADVQPGLRPPVSRTSSFDTMEPDLPETTGDDSDVDGGSPTMVGSVSLDIEPKIQVLARAQLTIWMHPLSDEIHFGYVT